MNHIFLENSIKNFLKKVLTCGSAIVLLYICPRDMKTYVHTNAYAWLFITALFVMTPNWKQSKCPLMGEQLNKVWYIYIMEHHSAGRRNERLLHAATWRDRKGIMLNEQKLISKNTSI